MNPNFLFVSLLLLAFPLLLSAQKAQESEHLFASEVFESERRIRIFIPERYFRDTNTVYTVTYVLDCQDDEVWNTAKGTIGYLVSRYRIMPMILVGIDSPNRGREFRPEREELRAHFREEVIPWVEVNHRVNDFRTVIGHSWGGAFIGSTLFGPHRDLFNAYIGVSPSLDAMGGLILKQADSILQAGEPLPKFLYCGSGDQGINEIESMAGLQSMDSLVQQYPVDGLVWQKEIFPGMDHWTCVMPTLNNGLVALSQQHFADLPTILRMAAHSETDLDVQIQAFYKIQKEKFGYVHVPSWAYLNLIAEDFKEQERNLAAYSILRWVTREDPTFLRAQINLVDVLRSLDEPHQARIAAAHALKILESQKEQVSESYYKTYSEWLRSDGGKP